MIFPRRGKKREIKEGKWETERTFPEVEMILGQKWENFDMYVMQ